MEVAALKIAAEQADAAASTAEARFAELEAAERDRQAGGCGGGLRTPGRGGDGGAGQRRPRGVRDARRGLDHGPVPERIR
jgi:hypothetical protein